MVVLLVLHFLILFDKINWSLAEYLFAASVNWRPSSLNGNLIKDEIIISYKLIWEQGNLPLCKAPNNDTTCYYYNAGSLAATKSSPGVLPVARWQGYKWKCSSGCASVRVISDLSSLYYIDVGTFHDVSWEAAMEMAVFKFNKSDDQGNIKIGFYDSADRLVGGFGEGMFNMAVRNDTNRPNISPAINPLPYYRVPLGCSITIPLFPFDGDGDIVRCHWQTLPLAGKPQSTAVLNEDQCVFTILADPNLGFTSGQSIPFSLYAEDYSTTPVKFSVISNDVTTGPFSRTPVKFLLMVSPRTANCNPGPNFIEAGTLSPNSIRSYNLSFQNAKLPFKIPTDDDQIILTSGPRYMGFKKNNISDTIEGTWDFINDTSMAGIHQACGMAYTKDGIPGESRCAVLMVDDPDECPCPNKNGIDGICRNLFEYNTCDYSFEDAKQQQQTMCKPVKPIKENNDDLGLAVGLPVGLSLLLLIIIIATAMYLKQHYLNKLKKSSVNPEHLQNGVGKLPFSDPGL